MTVAQRAALVALLILAGGRPALAAAHMVRNTEDSGEGSLREAVRDARDGDVVAFGSGVQGEILLTGTLDIDTDVTIKGPGATALTVRGVRGAVVSIDGSVALGGLTVAGGDTPIVLEKGKLTLRECAVVNGTGDGIVNRGGSLALVRSLVADNRGTGIVTEDGSTACVNSTIAGNGGSGLASRGGDVSAANCTIAANGGAGIVTSGGEATVRNTVIAGNVAGCTGPVLSNGYNLTDDSRCGFDGPGDIKTDDPRLGRLAANGGPTQTIALTGGSRAVDGGNPDGCVDPGTGSGLTVDQRGVRRPAGGRCDIGAFEHQPPIAGVVVDRILALIDGDPVTLYELKEFAATDPRMQAALVNEKAAVLDVLITKRLIDKEAERLGINVQEVDVDRYIADIRQRNNLSQEDLEAALRQQGLTLERYRAQVREELQRAQLITREIRSKVNVSPEEVERYYSEHGGGGESGEGGGKEGEQIAISHIFLKIPPGASPDQVAEVEARAEKILENLKGGADFAEVARRESEDGAAQSGGKLGTFKRSELRQSLEEAVADLEAGEFSKPIREANGVHIVRLDEIIVAEGGAGVPKAEIEEIKQQLYAKALEERYNRWLREDLRQRHHVEVTP